MGQVLHAAEDILAATRTGNRPCPADLIGDCLACLDQVGAGWTKSKAQGRQSPPASDGVVADSAARRRTSADADGRTGGRGWASDWLAPLLARSVRTPIGARSAFRFTPDPDCFFRGEDPLASVADLPGMLALELTPAEPWPALEELDPFACNLVITALLASSPDALRRFCGRWPARSEFARSPRTATAAPLANAPERHVAGGADCCWPRTRGGGFAGRLGAGAPWSLPTCWRSVPDAVRGMRQLRDGSGARSRAHEPGGDAQGSSAGRSAHPRRRRSDRRPPLRQSRSRGAAHARTVAGVAGRRRSHRRAGQLWPAN